jgi:uncharacterized protein YbjT (DUF2867 family)
MNTFAFILVCFGTVAHAAEPVVVTGATGRTGYLIYDLMKSHGHNVRALVRNATKARDILKCTKCDESEGIYEGDLTNPQSLKAVMAGASSLMIATSATPIIDASGTASFHTGAYPIDIDWHGAKNQLVAFAERSGASGAGHIALISTMGTTTPEDPKGQMFMDYIGFYKLNFEAELMSSGIPFTIIKPCGLDYSGTEPGKKELLTGHDDDMFGKVNPPAIPRADVARMMAAAIEMPNASSNLRFDLCSKEGTPTGDKDLRGVLEGARYQWQNENMVV